MPTPIRRSPYGASWAATEAASRAEERRVHAKPIDREQCSARERTPSVTPVGRRCKRWAGHPGEHAYALGAGK